MKKLILILAVMQLLIFSIYAQNSTGEKATLKALNAEVVTKFKAGKYDDALMPAKQAVDLSLKIFGAEHDETAAAYVNLGTLYRLKKKSKEATENLAKAVAIYNLKPSANRKALARTLDGLAAAYALDGDRVKVSEIYALAFTAAENAYGKESAEMLPFLKSMGEVYLYNKKYDEALETFVRRYKIVSKTLPENSRQLEEIGDEFTCFVHQYFKRDEVSGRQKQFSEAIQTEEEKSSAVVLDKIVKVGNVTTKAKKLVAPAYPPNARSRFAQGIIVIRVTIDEEGKVIDAKPACSGDFDLISASVAAAKKSKFSPTILGGTPVKVTGVLVYTFIP